MKALTINIGWLDPSSLKLRRADVETLYGKGGKAVGAKPVLIANLRGLYLSPDDFAALVTWLTDHRAVGNGVSLTLSVVETAPITSGSVTENQPPDDDIPF